MTEKPGVINGKVFFVLEKLVRKFLYFAHDIFAITSWMNWDLTHFALITVKAWKCHTEMGLNGSFLDILSWVSK